MEAQKTREIARKKAETREASKESIHVKTYLHYL